MAKEEKERTAKSDIKKLRKMIKDIRVAMMTTVGHEGELRSRPMATGDVEFDGDLWFFTRASSPKTEELMDDQRVNVSYADPKAQRYVSVCGRANLVKDREKIKELWAGFHKDWFPEGKKDPDLALIKVTVDRAEYWNAPARKMVHLAWLARAEDERAGANRKIDLDEEKAHGPGAEG